MRKHKTTAAMRLWSIQTPELLDALRRRGRVGGAWKRVDPDYRAAYQWMVRQMVERRVAERAGAPIWAWYAYRGEAKRRPDLRETGHLPRGTRGVLLELDVPASRVLLSCFDRWHWVLNGWFITENTDLMGNRNIARDVVEASWTQIFDIYGGSRSAWRRPKEREIQACLPYVELADVQSVRELVAR